jgi:hypothetical protein
MQNRTVDFNKYTVYEEILVKANRQIPRAGEGSAILLKDGSVMLAYSQFTGKADHDYAGIVSRISKDGGITWSAPKRMFERNSHALNVMSASFLRLQNGKLAFLYLHKFTKDNCIPYLCLSDDEGNTWSESIAVSEHGKYYTVNNDRFLQTRKGRLLIPATIFEYRNGVYDCNGGICGVFYSDNGISWRKSNFISIKNENIIAPHKIARNEIWQEVLNPGVFVQEPGVIELSDGRIMMWGRTNGGYMYKTVSDDNGESWSDFKPVPSIISPLGPQSIKRIPETSRLICIYNDHSTYGFGEENWWSWRTPLSIAISDDDGENWKLLGNIEDTSHNYCYTSMLFFDDKILLTYYLSENYIENGVEKRNSLASLKVKIIKNSAFLD